MSGENQPERAAVASRGLDGYPAAVLGHDLARLQQPEPSATGTFGREECREDLLLGLVVHPAAIVDDLEDQIAVLLGRLHGDMALGPVTRLAGIYSIRYQISQAGVDAFRVQRGMGIVRSQLHRQLDSRLFGRMLIQVHDVAGDPVDARDLDLRRTALREGEEIPNEG